MSDEKKIYVTTALAGFTVAGRRIPPVYETGKETLPEVGYELQLTDAEAEYELAQGTIELKQTPRKKASQAAVEGA